MPRHGRCSPQDYWHDAHSLPRKPLSVRAATLLLQHCTCARLFVERDDVVRPVCLPAWRARESAKQLGWCRWDAMGYDTMHSSARMHNALRYRLGASLMRYAGVRRRPQSVRR